MKRALRLMLLGVAIAVSFASSPKPADATIFCDSLQGRDCTVPPNRPYSCFWLPDLSPGTCFCNQGIWDCA
jgi:hypothetical protein